MARITVKDCLEKVPDHFELVLLAAEGARQLGRGRSPSVRAPGEARHLIALREIAAGSIPTEALREQLICRLQRAAPEQDLPDNDLPLDELAAAACPSPPTGDVTGPVNREQSHAA